jgi:hypothetical protein
MADHRNLAVGALAKVIMLRGYLQRIADLNPDSPQGFIAKCALEELIEINKKEIKEEEIVELSKKGIFIGSWE